MIEILKKQWFVVLIALILISFATFSVWDTNKGKLPGKSVDGKDVIATIADTNLLADDVFEQLKEISGDDLLFLKFQDAVASQIIETDDDIKSSAKLQAEQIEAGYKQNDPSNYKQTIQKQLDELGYKDLYEYALMSTKVTKIQTNYMDENMEKLFTPIHDEKKSRIVSHILIKMTDSANPTEEEAAKVKKVEEALASGTSFEDVAKEFSDDSSSANGGSIGYADSDSGLVTEFKDKALSLGKGEVSEWVKVSSTNYQGWHMIKVVESDVNELMKTEDEAVKNSIYKAIMTANENLNRTIIWEASKKLNVEFANDDVKKQLMDYMDIEE